MARPNNVTPLRGWLGILNGIPETDKPHGLGHGPAPMQAADPHDPVTAAGPKPDNFDDENIDEASLAADIRWLRDVISAHSDAQARRQLQHNTEMNKLEVKRQHYIAKRDERMAALALLMSDLGMTPDMLNAPPPEAEQQ